MGSTKQRGEKRESMQAIRSKKGHAAPENLRNENGVGKKSRKEKKKGGALTRRVYGRKRNRIVVSSPRPKGKPLPLLGGGGGGYRGWQAGGIHSFREYAVQGLPPLTL